MTSRHKNIVIIGIVVVTVGGLIAGQIGTRDRGVEVRIEEVGSNDLVATVVASGKIEMMLSVIQVKVLVDETDVVRLSDAVHDSFPFI